MKTFVQVLVLIIVALGGGYLYADAYDIVPGILTTRPADKQAEKYPSVKTMPSLRADSQFSEYAPSPLDGKEVQKLLDAFVKNKSADMTGRFSAFIIDSESGAQLASYKGNDMLVPASNMKLATAIAALDVLGPQTTFSTTTALEGSTVYLVGGGDVLLGRGKSDESSIYGHAGLEDLAEKTAQELKNKSVSKVSLKVDSSLFSGELYHSTITGADRKFVAEVRPIGAKETYTTENFSGSPDIEAANIFADHLKNKGIDIREVSRSDTSVPDDALQLASVESASVRGFVSYMLERSDNTTAETLAHLIALKKGKEATFANASQSVQESLQSLGIDVSGAVFADGSGLSENNRLSAKMLADMVQCIYKNEKGVFAGAASGLPVGNVSGTLDKRFTDDDMGARVHAKTGSLHQVRSLAGFVQTGNGRILTFALMNDATGSNKAKKDDKTQKFTDSRPLFDQFLTNLVELSTFSKD
ncbi:MAG: D-alanyl-D-alanine carboxypeptidase/D-alanyl-D-alanine-endopeptidase [Actinomycetaceae bacterium]|nr:D-alanyl-D-alanine carboxypeptidase/D-alanyl-D-alanine-endopeptidase [Actinomycetaceae bacterium]